VTGVQNEERHPLPEENEEADQEDNAQGDTEVGGGGDIEKKPKLQQQEEEEEAEADGEEHVKDAEDATQNDDASDQGPRTQADDGKDCNTNDAFAVVPSSNTVQYTPIGQSPKSAFIGLSPSASH